MNIRFGAVVPLQSPATLDAQAVAQLRREHPTTVRPNADLTVDLGEDFGDIIEADVMDGDRLVIQGFARRTEGDKLELVTGKDIHDIPSGSMPSPRENKFFSSLAASADGQETSPFQRAMDILQENQGEPNDGERFVFKITDGEGADGAIGVQLVEDIRLTGFGDADKKKPE